MQFVSFLAGSVKTDLRAHAIDQPKEEGEKAERAGKVEVKWAVEPTAVAKEVVGKVDQLRVSKRKNRMQGEIVWIPAFPYQFATWL